MRKFTISKYIIFFFICFALSGCGKVLGTAEVTDITAVSENNPKEVIYLPEISDSADSNSNKTKQDNVNKTEEKRNETSKPAAIEFTISGNQTVRFSSFDLTDTYEEETATKIQMNDMQVTIIGDGAEVEENRIIINQKGTYIFEGTLSNGQIYVQTEYKEKVQLVLNNVDISCTTSAPIYIENADKTVITLAEGSENILTDCASPYDDSIKGCIFSKDDLTLNGTGILTVNGNYNNAISCKNELKITGGTYYLTAVNNALKGNDSITILDCDMTITSYDDGFKVSNEKNEEKGYLFIADGNFTITANDDCFQCTRSFEARGGHAKVRCYGEPVNCDGYTDYPDHFLEMWK